MPSFLRMQARTASIGIALLGAIVSPAATPAFDAADFIEKYCADCHDNVEAKGGLDLASLSYQPGDAANFSRWVKVHDRLATGEMPSKKKKKRPDAPELGAFVQSLASTLTASEREAIEREGRATQRRLNGYEYENALRDLLSAPWLQVRGQFSDDGEAKRLLREEDALLARNLTRQLLVFATGAPVRFSDRKEVEAILQRAGAQRYGLRTLIHEIVQSPLFPNK